MTDAARPNLDDACALLDRARTHFTEFKELIVPRRGEGLWRTSESRDADTGDWLNCLHMDRARLIKAKSIIADSANNVVSSLDQVAAAIAKANGYDRLRSLYFPWGLADEAFERALAKVEPVLGTEMAEVLAATRKTHQHEVCHVEAAKQISNSGKHWELMVSTGTAHGVALHVPGSEQRIFQVPADAFAHADSFEYYRGAERLPRVPFSIIIGQTIAGLDDALPKSPDSILECSFRFVEGVIAAISEAEN